MNEPVTQTDPAPEAPPKRRRFPWVLTILSFVAVGLMVCAQGFADQVEDLTGVTPDFLFVGALLFCLSMFACWAVWCLFRRAWVGLAISVGVPVLFFSLFRLTGGDLNVVEWRWKARPELSAEHTNTKTDLSKPTPGDFPQFLGPDRNTVSGKGAVLTPVRFADATVVWKQPIGRGWSGFVARNGFAVTMEQRGEHECVTCYEIRTGELRWLYRHKARHRDEMDLGKTGPRATPTIHDGKVYACGAVGNLVCLDGTDGSVVWQKDLNEILGITLGTKTAEGYEYQFEANTTLSWGRSGSPLVVGETVVVPGGGPEGEKRATLVAFDKATGELRWRGGREMIAYGSPVLATVSGVEQILLTGENEAMGFDAATGKQLWSHSRPGQSNGGANTSQVTVVSDTQVLTSKGYPDGGGELITLVTDGGELTPRSEWESARVLKTKLTSPVIYQGHAYALSSGFMECSRVSDGKRMWKKRGSFGHGQILLAGDLLLIHSERGRLSLITPSPDGYQEHGRMDTIDGICWNTLCLYDRWLLVRSDLEAACIDFGE